MQSETLYYNPTQNGVCFRRLVGGPVVVLSLSELQDLVAGVCAGKPEQWRSFVAAVEEKLK